jgi:hypothetical protein
LDSFVDLDVGKPRTLAELRAIEPEIMRIADAEVVSEKSDPKGKL